MDFITGMFKGMFRMSARRYEMRAKAKVRAKTVGKAQAKILKARTKLDKKVNKAQDKVLEPKFGKGKGKKKGIGASPAKKGGGGAAPAGGGGGGGRAPVGGGGGGRAPVGGGGGGRAPSGGGRAPVGGGGRAPAGPGRAPVGPGAAPPASPGGAPQGGAAAGRAPGRPPVGPVGPPMQQQGAGKMGKGKRNKGQVPAGQMVACVNCGAGLQPDWDLCPYCGSGQMAPDPGYGQMQGYGPQPVQAAQVEVAEKTVAINLDDLKKKKNRPVVGWIVAQNGNHRGMDFRLYDGKNLLGTAADCDIVITDPYLSAKHCTIRHEDGNFVLIDLDSTNGTFVNQKRVSTMELIDNDTIRFGRTEFKFKALF